VAFNQDSHAYLTISLAVSSPAKRCPRGYQADRCAYPSEPVPMRLADAGLSMKAISSTAIGAGGG
jgi:hypothetical protein